MSHNVLRGMHFEFKPLSGLYVSIYTTRDAFWIWYDNYVCHSMYYEGCFLKWKSIQTFFSKNSFKTPFQNTFQNIFWKYHLKHLFKTSFKNIFQNIFSKHLLKHLFKILFHWNTLKTFMHWNRIYRAFGLVLFYNLGTWRHYILSSALGDTGQSWTQHHW